MSISQRFREHLGFGVSRSAVYTVMLAFLVAACSDDGCSSCACGGFTEGPYPANAPVVQLSGQVRVTPSGLDFLETNIGTLISQAVPGGLSFCIPSGDQICQNSTCSTGEAGCDLSVTIDSAELNPTPPDTLDIEITVGDLQEQLPIRILSTNCVAKLQHPSNSSLPGQIRASVPVTISVDPITKDTQIELGELDLDLSNLKIDIDGSGLGVIVCESVDAAASIGFVRNLIIGQLTPTLQDTIDDLVGSQLCRTCDTENPCSPGTCDSEGVCRYADNRCVPRKLGTEGRFLVGDALADFTEHPESAMDLVLKAADYAAVNDGLTLGIRSGFEPDLLRRCVPADPTRRPNDAPIPLDTTVTGNLKPNGQPFMFGFGYHKKAVQHLLWSVWGSGATCLMIGSDSIDSIQLSTSLFTALLPSLRNVVPGGSAIYIKIVPQQAPDVVLGQNRVMPSGTTYTIEDPLMTIDWKDLDIHIYAFGQERWTRLFTLRGDLVIPVAIVPDGMGKIVPVLGDLNNAVVNIRPIDSELVSEDPQKLIDLLPTLLGAALPALAGAIGDPIELPDLLGLQLQLGPEDITSVDNGNMIGIFANLAAGAPQPYVIELEPMIASAQVEYTTLPSGMPRPIVHLQTLALPIDDSFEREFSWRVDDGFWSQWVRDTNLAINDPRLTLPGNHTVAVRARIAGTPESTSELVATHEVVIDWDTPTVRIERDANLVSFAIEDTIAEDVQVRWRLVGEGLEGNWTSWGNVRELDLSTLSLPEPFRIDVEAKDREERLASDTRTVHRALEGIQPAPSTPKTGCSAVGGTPLWILALLPFALRRRRRNIFAALLAITLFGAACSDDATTPTPCSSCPDGTYCGADNTCVEGCLTNDHCAEGQVCDDSVCISQCEYDCGTQCGSDAIASCGTDNVCVCTEFCGGDCGDNSFCCRNTNSCQQLADPCEKVVCDPGFGPVQSRPASGDSMTCDIDTGACDCQPLPPLPLGYHGHYLSSAQAGTTVLVATYNSTYTDLMVGAFNGGQDPVWTFVDGVPETGDIFGALDGPRGGIRDQGPNAGTHTAMAVDASGVAHIFYRHETSNTMRYARGTGANADWNFQTKVFDTDSAGFYPDVVIKDGTVHVVYLADNVGAEGEGFQAELRHSSFLASSPMGQVTAEPVVIYTSTSSNPCGGRCGTGQQCFASESTCARPTSDCANACGDGQACFNGSCLTTYSSSPEAFRKTTGLVNQLNETANGLILAFYDELQQSVAHTRFDGTSWQEPTFVGTPSGPYASAIVDQDQNLHLAFMDTTANRLVYQGPTGPAEMIADGLRDSASGWIVNDIGEDVMLRLNSDGTLYAVFHDATRHTLHLATRAMTGWTIENLATRDPFTGSHGFFATMLRVPSDLVVVAMTYHQTGTPPRSEPVLYRK